MPHRPALTWQDALGVRFAEFFRDPNVSSLPQYPPLAVSSSPLPLFPTQVPPASLSHTVALNTGIYPWSLYIYIYTYVWHVHLVRKSASGSTYHFARSRDHYDPLTMTIDELEMMHR